MISRLAHDLGVGSLICVQGIPVPQIGFVEFHAFFVLSTQPFAGYGAVHKH